MKNSNNITARGWVNQRSGIIQVKVVFVTAMWVLAGVGFYDAHAAPDNPSGQERAVVTANGKAVPVGDTNSAVASLAADLQRLQAKIEGAVAAMSNAATSSPALQAAKVTKLADEIEALGSKELGDSGEIIKQADALIAKFHESVAKARKGSSDPNTGASAREIYGRLLPNLESELAKLIDAKSTAARIRAELLRQAEGLRQSADAIGFAEHCNELVLASQAFRDTLSQVTKFTEKVSQLIQTVGKGAPVPLT